MSHFSSVDSSACFGASESSSLPSSALDRTQEFDALYEDWFPRVRTWTRRLGAKGADVDDLAQDVFLIVYRRLSDFDRRNVAGWLYCITRRRVRDWRRLAWTERRICTDVLEPPLQISAAERRVEASINLNRIRLSIAQLPEDEREALLLFELTETSGRDVARRQGVPLNTAWARIRRARTKLTDRIQADEGHFVRTTSPYESSSNSSLRN